MAEQLLQSASSLTSQLADIEQDLVKVVKSAVRKIISDFHDDKLVLEAVKKGLIPVYKNQRVAIRVNPAMLPTVLDSIDAMNHKIEFLDVQPDERLKKTDCVIESDIGIIDASIESQLSAIEKALNVQFPQRKAS
jgi:type III secretion protein L